MVAALEARRNSARRVSAAGRTDTDLHEITARARRDDASVAVRAGRIFAEPAGKRAVAGCATALRRSACGNRFHRRTAANQSLAVRGHLERGDHL